MTAAGTAATVANFRLWARKSLRFMCSSTSFPVSSHFCVSGNLCFEHARAHPFASVWADRSDGRSMAGRAPHNVRMSKLPAPNGLSASRPGGASIVPAQSPAANARQAASGLDESRRFISSRMGPRAASTKNTRVLPAGTASDGSGVCGKTCQAYAPRNKEWVR